MWRSELYFLPQFIYERKTLTCNILLLQCVQFRTNNSAHTVAISVITAISNSTNHQRSNCPHCTVRCRYCSRLLSSCLCTLSTSTLSMKNFHFRSARRIAKKRLLASSCLSVRRHGTIRLPLDGISWYLMFDNFFFFFENLSRKFKLY